MDLCVSEHVLGRKSRVVIQVEPAVFVLLVVLRARPRSR